MRKPWLALGLALLLCLWTASALAMSRQQALDKAYALIKTYLHYDQNALNPHQSMEDSQTGRWRMSFLLKKHEPDNDGLVVVEIAADGSLLEIAGPNPLDDDQQLARAMQEAQPYTVDSMLALQATWAHRLPRMIANSLALNADASPAQLAQSKYHWNALALSYDIRQPGEGALTLDEAAEKARQYALSQPGWSQAGLDMMEQTLALYYYSPAFEKPVWHVVFGLRSVADPLYNHNWDRYERLYLKPLYKLFGGDNANTPRYISLMLDGSTGELLETPVTPYPGPNGIPWELSQMK